MTISFSTLMRQRAQPQIQRPLARELICKGAGAVRQVRRANPSQGRNQNSSDPEQRESRGPDQTSLRAPPSLVPLSPGACAFAEQPPPPGLQRPHGCPSHAARAGAAAAVAIPHKLRTRTTAGEWRRTCARWPRGTRR